MSIFSWLKRRRLDLDDDDFQDEIRAHLAIAEEERVADGADREAAHYAALKDFGNVTLTTEAARRVWMPAWLEVLRDYLRDMRYALRALAKKGWVTAKWGVTDANQRAKFYRLTPEGKKQLVREESRWTELVNAIGRVMNPSTAPGSGE